MILWLMRPDSVSPNLPNNIADNFGGLFMIGTMSLVSLFQTFQGDGIREGI